LALGFRFPSLMGPPRGRLHLPRGKDVSIVGSQVLLFTFNERAALVRVAREVVHDPCLIGVRIALSHPGSEHCIARFGSTPSVRKVSRDHSAGLV